MPRVLVRIQPSDGAVSAAVDDVHALAARVLKYDQGRARQVEFGHGGGDGQGFERLRALRDDDWTEIGRRLFVLVRGREHEIGGPAPAGVRRPGRLAVFLEPFVVPAQPALDLVGRLLETRVRLVRAALGLEIHARTQVKRTIRPIGRALGGNHDMTAGLTVEIARHHGLDFLHNVSPKRLTDVEVLARYSQWHGSPSLAGQLPTPQIDGGSAQGSGSKPPSAENSPWRDDVPNPTSARFPGYG